MPFKSKAQLGYMFAKKPKIAKEWASKYGVPKNLPKKKGGVNVRTKVRKKRHKKFSWEG